MHFSVNSDYPNLTATSPLSLEANRKASLAGSLQYFLAGWEEQYCKKVKSFYLFNSAADFSWSEAKKQFFCRLFYHAHKHLRDFYPPSHARLYFSFTKDMGFSSTKEVIAPLYCLPFLKKFNQERNHFLDKHSWDICLAAYIAYARLDNLDCKNLLEIAKKLGTSPEALLFFKIRHETKYFIATKDMLRRFWNINQQGVKKAFDFTAHHQIAMWEKLSELMFNYPEGLQKLFYTE